MKPQTQYKLEYKLLFSLVVAGKSAKFAEKALSTFLAPYEAMLNSPNLPRATPFEIIGRMYMDDELRSSLIAARTGNYTKLERAFKAILEANLDLRVCSPSDLEKVPGIGPKTSRFYILWTRPDARYAALDTHILKWLRYLGYDAPMSTPTGKKYAELEQAFLAEADKRGIKPASLDYAIWEYCRDGKHKDGEWPKEFRK